MATKVEKGYEYKGLKLGEEVIFKEDGEEYEIVGFDLSLIYGFIAINKQGFEYGIQDTIASMAVYYKETDSFEWVGLDEIEKIQKEEKLKTIVPDEKDKIKVYLSSKVTSNANYKSEFQKVEDYITENLEKLEVVNPVKICESKGLTYWDECMKVCIGELVQCDKIIVFGDYINSKGALLELEIAEKLGLEVIIFDELVEFMKFDEDIKDENDISANEYQELAMRTCNTKDKDMLVEGVFGLVGEAGEVVDIVKKHLFQGHNLDIDGLKDELGDVCWYISILAHYLELDLGDILNCNIDKLRKRYPEGFKVEDSVNRGGKESDEIWKSLKNI